MNRYSLRFVDLLGAVGLIVSLFCVAYEIRQNTMAARAASIQQLGIATAQMWGEFSRNPAMLRTFYRTDISIADWTADNWVRHFTQMLAWSRLAETGLLQVSEGLLPSSSLDTLGYSLTKYWLQDPSIYCVWEYGLGSMVSDDFAAYVESGPEPIKVDCGEFENFPFNGSVGSET